MIKEVPVGDISAQDGHTGIPKDILVIELEIKGRAIDQT